MLPYGHRALVSVARVLVIVGVLFCIYWVTCVNTPAANKNAVRADRSGAVSIDSISQEPTQESCADLIDQLLPYMTSEGFTAENQDEIAALFSEGMERGADPLRLLIYVQFRMGKNSEYSIGYYSSGTVLELSLGKRRQATKEDRREYVPVYDSWLLFAISEKDKTMTPNGLRKLEACYYEPLPAR